MKRRDFLTLLGGAAVIWPRAARAQQAAEPVIGILSDGLEEAYEARRLPGFVRGLSDEGLAVGRNVTIESRWANGNYDLLPSFAADLVRRHAGVIVTGGSEAVVRAAQAVSGTVPVVATMAGDPVARGFVASVNRPGGNLTVVSLFTFDNNALVAKRLDLLHQLVPRATTVGWLADSHILDFEDELREFRGAAATLGLGATFVAVPRADDIEAALLSLVRQRAGALMEAGPVLSVNRERLVSLATREAVPVMYEWPEFVAEGGLVSYGTDPADIWRQAGIYAARILRGEKAGDLPVVEPDKYRLVINLKTAKTLRLTVPPALLVGADEVVE
jgi:putative tryptophan/tyrosine transport system substrate-binding protein